MTFKIRNTLTGTSLDSSVPDQLVLHSDGYVKAPNQYGTTDENSLATLKMVHENNGNMFDIGMWTGTLDKIPQGRFALNGQQVSELQVPGLQAAISATGQPTVTAAEWQSDVATNCGKFGIGDGFTILPDWMGATPGSVGKLYFAGSSTLRGTVVSDAIRNITGSVPGFFAQAAGTGVGALSKTTNGGNSGINAGSGTGYQTISLDASLAVPTAEENRPKTVYGIWTIQLFGSFTGLLEYDVAAHTAMITAQNARIAELESKKNTGTGDAPYFGCRAWGSFSGMGTATLHAGGNVLSVVDNGVGRYTVNFIEEMPSTSYSVQMTIGGSQGAGTSVYHGVFQDQKTKSSVSLYVRQSGNYIPAPMIDFAIFA